MVQKLHIRRLYPSSQDLVELQVQQDKEGNACKAGATDSCSASVRIVLASFKKQLQQAAAMLATFPSAFSDTAAAHILGQTASQARGTLAVLHRHTVLQLWGSGQQHMMHAVVREQVKSLVACNVQQQAEARFIAYMLGQLTEWAGMYRTSKEWRLALAAAREHMPDIGKLLELVLQPPRAGKATWDPVMVSLALTDELRLLLEAVGMLQQLEPACSALLGHLQTSILAPDTAAADPPSAALARTHLLRTLAWVQCRGGKLVAGEATAMEAVKAAVQHWGNGHPGTAAALNAHAACLYISGQYSEARETFQEVLRLRRLEHGEEHADTAFALNNLAAALFELGQHVEAEQLYRAALDVRSRLLGETHPDTATSISNLANCLSVQCQHESAEAVYRKALRLQQAVLGEEHYSVAHTMFNIAECLDDQGRHEDAEAMYRKVWDVRQRVLGDAHQATAQVVQNLAVCVHSQGRFLEAETLYMQAIGGWEGVCSRNGATVDMGLPLMGLARCLKDQDRLHEAEEAYRKLLSYQRNAVGSNDASTTQALDLLAACLEQQGELKAAEGLRQEAWQLMCSRHGDEHPDTLAALGALVNCLQSQERHQDVEGLIRTAWQQHEARCKEQQCVPGTVLLSQLASVLEREERYNEAEQVLRQLHALRAEQLGQEHPKAIGALRRLAECLEMQESYDAAEVLYRDILVHCKCNQGEHHQDTAAALADVAGCVYAQERFDEAAGLFKAAVQVAARTLGEGDPFTVTCMENLQACLEAQDLPFDASAVLSDVAAA